MYAACKRLQDAGKYTFSKATNLLVCRLGHVFLRELYGALLLKRFLAVGFKNDPYICIASIPSDVVLYLNAVPFRLASSEISAPLVIVDSL